MPKLIEEIPIVALRLNYESGTPLYKQLYDLLRSAILEGKIRAGQKIPGTRSLSAELKISRNTAATAIDQLRIEGYVTGKSGSGFVVNEIPDKKPILSNKNPEKVSSIRKINLPNKIPENLRQRFDGDQSVIPFQNGIPALNEFPMRTWLKLLNQITINLSNLQLGYGDAAGYRPLREAIAAYLKSYRAVNCNADKILIVNGSQQGLDLIARILLKKGSNVWIEDPGYGGVRASMIAAGVKLYPCPLDDEGLDVNYSEKHNPIPDLIYATPSHQFPTGVTISISRRLQLLNYAAKNKCWIVEDDYDSEFRYIGHPLPSLQGMDQHKTVLYLGTFSKVLVPGLRLGYLVLPDSSMLETFKSVKYIMDRQSPVFEQIVLARYIEEGHFTKHIRRMRMLYKLRQEFLVNEINKNFSGLLSAEPFPSGMHIIARLLKKMNDRQVSVKAREQKIIVHPLSDYSMKFHKPPGLIMGYTGFTESEIKEGLTKLKSLLMSF